MYGRLKVLQTSRRMDVEYVKDYSKGGVARLFHSADKVSGLSG